MFLFKARKRARAEFKAQLAEKGITMDVAKRKATRKKKYTRGIWYPKHEVVGTGANTVVEL